MKVLGANISHQTAEWLSQKLSAIALFETANMLLIEAFGIKDFFVSQEEYTSFKEALTNASNTLSEPDRTEYGDFQTNRSLAESVTQFLKIKKKINPKRIIEPTCGKGHFIVAALATFKQIETIIGLEIYKPYTWEAKFNIIDFCVAHPSEKRPNIEILHFNVFEFDFQTLAGEAEDEILVLGNPPWVTSAQLSSLDSSNLPEKSNFKKYKGLDAITGKGNFDIGEYITLMLFDAFQNTPGHVAFLVKNTVIKNIVFDQYKRKYNIAEIEKLTIDSKKEFEVSVEAALLFCKLNSPPTYTCQAFDFYRPNTPQKAFGWVADKFVSDITLYQESRDIDGLSPFEWRQGIKHDLAAVMELERINGHFVNGKQEEVLLEEDLVFGFLKSSDLKQPVIRQARKFTIVTQKKVGQDTAYIQEQYPQTFQYLFAHKASFDQRKSSIYNDKPDFSIFGIGDYSFAPYKVVISGLYKTFTFSLVLPLENKALMLDDTCYLLGFQKLEYALYTSILLNSEKAKKLLQAIAFADAKRTFTKEILMRIDLHKLACQFPLNTLQSEVKRLCEKFQLQASLNHWEDFLQMLQPKSKEGSQMTLF